MIIGNGSLARILNDRKEFIFFASGISNSGMDNQTYWTNEKYREISLLTYYIKESSDFDFMFVYFSTISKFYNDSPYVKHKNEMEMVIRELTDNYCIINLGNIYGDTNPNTFINFIRAKQAKGEPVEIRDEYKFMISKDQLLFITDNLPLKGKHEISVFGEMRKVNDLI